MRRRRRSLRNAERIEIARAVFLDMPNVEVDSFDGLLVDYVQRRQAQVIVRGLRAVSDLGTSSRWR